MTATWNAANPTAAARAPHVLVLLATHNGAPWIEAQLRSIGAQHAVEVSLRVGDDGSTDQTVPIVQRWAAKSSRRVVLSQAEQPSGAAARNFFRLIREAELGDETFVALADQDDLWEPDKLQRAVQALRTTSSAGYSAAVRAFWPDGRTAVLTQVPRQTAADYLFEGAGQGCTFVMQRSFFDRVQQLVRQRTEALDTVHYHDWLIYALCRAWGLRWHFDDAIALRYRQHGSNDTGARGGRVAMARRLSLIRSGWYARQIGAIAAIVADTGDAQTEFARRWLALSRHAAQRPLYRAALAAFILRQGRRRWTDRLIQIGAATAGYLDAPHRDDR